MIWIFGASRHSAVAVPREMYTLLLHGAFGQLRQYGVVSGIAKALITRVGCEFLYRPPPHIMYMVMNFWPYIFEISVEARLSNVFMKVDLRFSEAIRWSSKSTPQTFSNFASAYPWKY